MEFKKIQLNGFKSFAERTEFQIEDGLTGIVGPNGCGKTTQIDEISKWLPHSGLMGKNSKLVKTREPGGSLLGKKLRNLILPSIVLGIRPISIISMLMRNSMIQTLNQNYILTAYSKGLSKYKVIVNHCLKNSLNPVVTALSGWFASLLAGSVFVEYIFGWNGLGREIVNSLNNLDVPVIIGAVTVISLSFILINIFVDEIYKYLDPRIN